MRSASSTTCSSARSSATTTSRAARATSSSPDIATSVPKPTNGGKTYTFHIKPGVKFSPPVNRAGHLGGLRERDASASRTRRTAASTRFYYNVIKGWDAYAAGKAKSISGIKTPNATTIVFNLTAPTGDFLYRMAHARRRPAAGRGHEVLRGPARQVRPRPDLDRRLHDPGRSTRSTSRRCAAIKPASGYDGQTIMDLVRNPNYKQSTDPTAQELRRRGPVPRRRERDDIYNKIEAGQLDMAISSIPPQVAAEVRDDLEPEAALLTELG